MARYKNGSPDPFHAYLGIVCLSRLTLDTAYLFITFEESSFSHSRDMKEYQRHKIRVIRVPQGHQQHHHPMKHI